MNDAIPVVRTRLRDELSPPVDTDVERGVRYWASVEIPSDAWFVVEALTDHGGNAPRDFQRWICASPEEAASRAGLSGLTRSKLLAYARVPIDSPQGFAFGEVAEILTAEHSRTHLIRYKHGMSVLVGGDLGSSGRAVSQPEGMRRIYIAS